MTKSGAEHFLKFTSFMGDEGTPFDDHKDPAWHAWLPSQLGGTFERGTVIANWDPTIEVEIDCGKHAPNVCPDIYNAATDFIVSDRCRKVIESVAPGQAQFLGFVPKPKKCEITNSPLWIMNMLRLPDCIDMALSKAKPPVDQYDTYNWGTINPIVDPRRIPHDDMIFRLKHHSVVTLVRTELRDAIRGAGLTGGGFHRWHWWVNEDGTGSSQLWPQ